MEGFLFLWISWMIWIIVTFLLPKTSTRTVCAIFILSTISLSSVYIVLDGLTIYVSIMVLFICGLWLISETGHWLRYILTSTAVGLGFTGYLFWEQIMPVMLLLSRNIVIPFIASLLLFFITKNARDQLAVWISSACLGECIHSFILHGYGVNTSVGELRFLDVICTTIAFLFVMHGFMVFRRKLYNAIDWLEKQNNEVKS
ncbi:YphA family membrane protein [Radiobacillus deserti]|uniref:Uncharacterized protein n=1 Tax=Radiobacillus deserti TaxID=2594883 RepID=A0A516KGF4_9BACI|nr:hypothetical protein [Radiobacillus deserti]QDP40475.1 hypothetical protein FN924_09925 [Radiobacillus deserti]